MEIRSAIESRRDGMRKLEQSPAELVREGHMTYAAARDHANNAKDLDRHAGSAPSEAIYRCR